MALARQRIRLPPGCWRTALAGLFRGDLWEGDAIGRLESAFAEFIGAGDAIAVPSGRSGLRLIFETMDLPAGSEVLFSAFGYPVVPHLARAMGHDVKFVDCELETLGLDPERLAESISDRTAAVVVTHLYGVPCRIEEIAALAAKHGAKLIEDCAHCYGASVGGRKVGAFGDFAYFSFETSKPINALGGGMVTARERRAGERLRELARSQTPNGPKWLLKRLLTTTFEATVTHPVPFNLGVYPALRLAQRGDAEDDRFASGYHADEVTLKGRTGRFTNFQARLALRQMDRALPQIERRVALAERLRAALDGKVHFQANDRDGVHTNTMLITALFEDMRRVSRELLRRGVDSKYLYMRDCSGIVDQRGRFPNAARAEREVLHLPTYPELSEADVDRIARSVEAVVDAGAGARGSAAVSRS